MGKVLGIGLFVLGLWFAAQTYLGGRPPGDDTSSVVPPTQKARDAVLRAHEQGEERLKKLLPE